MVVNSLCYECFTRVMSFGSFISVLFGKHIVRLKTKKLSMSLTLAGRLFHSVGAAIWNDLSPRVTEFYAVTNDRQRRAKKVKKALRHTAERFVFDKKILILL